MPGNDSVCARSSSSAPAQALPSTWTLRGTSSSRAFHATAAIAPQTSIEPSSSSVCHWAKCRPAQVSGSRTGLTHRASIGNSARASSEGLAAVARGADRGAASLGVSRAGSLPSREKVIASGPVASAASCAAREPAVRGDGSSWSTVFGPGHRRLRRM